MPIIRHHNEEFSENNQAAISHKVVQSVYKANDVLDG